MQQDWLTEQQWRQTHPEGPASMTEAHLHAHNRNSSSSTSHRPFTSPRPPSVRNVPVPLESTLQAISASLQALHERISSLELQNQRQNARQKPWQMLFKRLLYTLSVLGRSPSASTGGVAVHARFWADLLLGVWDQIRDGILIALLVALLLRQRRTLIDLRWIRRLLPRYRLRLVQAV